MSTRTPLAVVIRCGWQVLLAWSLAACAGPGPLAPGDAGAGPAGSATAASALANHTLAQALPAFEARQRAEASAAEQQGRWADAAWAWEALQAVRPGDDAVAARLRQARTAADSRATLLTQQARLSLQLNDAAAARDLFLRALTLQPTHAEAIDGLRALESSQLRQRISAARQVRSSPARTPALRQTADFASLLVAQGELERAVELLRPLASGRQPDPALRQQLSDVYLLWAERLHGQDPGRALATLRKSLQTDPRNARAAARLREWQRSGAPRSQRAPPTPAAGKPAP